MSDPLTERLAERLGPLDYRVIQRLFDQWIASRDRARLPQIEIKPALKTFVARTKGRAYHRDMIKGINAGAPLKASGATAFEIGAGMTDADEPTVWMARCASYIDDMGAEQAVQIGITVTEIALANAARSTTAIEAAMLIHDLIDLPQDGDGTAYFAHYIFWSMRRYPALSRLVPRPSWMIGLWGLVHAQADPLAIVGGNHPETPAEPEAEELVPDRPTSMTQDDAFAMLVPMAWLDDRGRGIGTGPMSSKGRAFTPSVPDAVLPLRSDAAEAQREKALAVTNAVGVAGWSDASRANILQLVQGLELEHGEEGARRFAERTYTALSRPEDIEMHQLWMAVRAFIDLEKAVRSGQKFEITHPLRTIRYVNDGSGLQAVHADGASVSYVQATSRIRPASASFE